MQDFTGEEGFFCTGFQAALVAIVTDSSSWARALCDSVVASRAAPTPVMHDAAQLQSSWKLGLPHFWGEGSML